MTAGTDATPRANPPGVLASFQEPEFRKVWLGAVLFGLGMWMEWLAIGWFVLDETGSVFLAALSFAIRTVPNLVLGPIGGAASDRFPRARVLLATSLVRMTAAVLMALVVFVDFAPVPILLALVFVTGSTIAFQNTSLQPLQAEIVGPERLGNAVSLTSFGQRSIGVAGALTGGVLIGWLGPGPTFLVGAVPLAGAALMFARLRRTTPTRRTSTTFAADVVEGLRLIVQTPMVRLLLGMMILVEILGFSFNGLLPAVAERVLEVGPERLGVLTAGVSVGAMLGTMFLVITADRLPRGLMLIAVFATFGSLIVVLGNSTIFWLSAAAVAGDRRLCGDGRRSRVDHAAGERARSAPRSRPRRLELRDRLGLGRTDHPRCDRRRHRCPRRPHNQRLAAGGVSGDLDDSREEPASALRLDVPRQPPTVDATRPGTSTGGLPGATPPARSPRHTACPPRRHLDRRTKAGAGATASSSGTCMALAPAMRSSSSARRCSSLASSSPLSA